MYAGHAARMRRELHFSRQPARKRPRGRQETHGRRVDIIPHICPFLYPPRHVALLYRRDSVIHI
jgi:hypothetical protein